VEVDVRGGGRLWRWTFVKVDVRGGERSWRWTFVEVDVRGGGHGPGGGEVDQRTTKGNTGYCF
jgi:hypothetical protein